MRDRTRVAGCSQAYRPPEPRDRGQAEGGGGSVPGTLSAF